MKTYPYPVDPQKWNVFQRTNVACAVKPLANEGIEFAFNVSAQPDPNSAGPWCDYLLADQLKVAPILGTHLAFSVQSVCTPGTKYNFMSDPNNFAGTTPAAARPMIKTGAWSDLYPGAALYGIDRWWCDSVFHPLGNDPAPVLLDCPLDPAQWSTVFGAKANSSPAMLAAFNATITAPTMFGLTMGGGFYYGHGVCVTGGTASFKVHKMYSHD